LWLAVTVTSSLLGAVSAFPGALGWAAQTTTGGRGGKIIKVTTLNRDGSGSLSEALNTKGSRIIVFEVGGVIDLGAQELSINEPDFSIAGQTAPAPGITLVRGGITLRDTHNIIIQHLLVRSGECGFPKGGVRGKPGHDFDGISTDNAYDVIIDHCSVAWATDESISPSGPRTKGGTTVEDFRKNTSRRVTIQNCIMAEGLLKSIHGSYPQGHSKGTLIHDNVTQVLVARNVYISHDDRHPAVKAGGQAAVVNNWVFNPMSLVMHSMCEKGEWGKFEPISPIWSIVGNVVELGPDSKKNIGFFRWTHKQAPQAVPKVFMDDNIFMSQDKQALPMTPENEGEKINYAKLDKKAVWPDVIDVLPAAQVKEYVAKNAGARPWNRDPIDKRVINDALVGKGKIINEETAVEGYPNYAPTKAAFNPADWDLDTMQPKKALK
jgi:pectate lyase